MSNQKKQRTTDDAVTMIGLDFGSTTSSAIVARAHVGMNSVTGRMSFGNPDIIFRSAPIFTPFVDDILDESALRMHIRTWLQESRVTQKDLFCGGAIITGLATEKANAGCIADIVKEHVGEVIIATASDPCLESWLAFMGSCSALSRCNSNRPIINLDIGGGTTNPAIGINGNVLSTGCYFVGARHFQFEPGTYNITVISRYGRILLNHLGISKNPGDSLKSNERDAILDFYLSMLETIVRGSGTFSHDAAAIAHTQIPLFPKEPKGPPLVTFSGGVGELIYGYAINQYLPETTYYGDLGIDLARRILASPLLSEHIADMVPENMGRATVYGLAIHSTEVSGSTLFIPRQPILPLRDLPIVGRMSMNADRKKIAELISLVAKSAGGGAIHITTEAEELHQEGILQGPPVENLERVKCLGQKICDVLLAEDAMADKPLLLLVPHNCGKSLGNYATNWRKAAVNLIVIDEILDRSAHFVNVGSMYNNIVPVSFYGVQ